MDPAIESRDPSWEAALDWWLRLQDQPGDEALQRQVRHWLDADPAHQAAFERARRVWLLGGELKFSPVTAAPRRRRARVRAGLACAASLLLAVFMLPWLFATPDWQSATGEHREVRLEDGSWVTLASDSAIDVRFDAGTRRVLLRKGRAFFDVKPDPARPFVVEASPLRVRVAGTRFDVALYDSQATVEVASGSVSVSGERVDGDAALRAGQRLSLRHGAHEWRQEAVPPEQVAAWRDWQLLLHDRPLREAVEQLRPYLPGVVLMPDAALADRRLTARLDLQAPGQALLAVVEAAGGRLRAPAPYLRVLTGR